MLRTGDAIRLTPDETHRLRLLTGADPGSIKTAGALRRLISAERKRYQDDTPENMDRRNP